MSIKWQGGPRPQEQRAHQILSETWILVIRAVCPQVVRNLSESHLQSDKPPCQCGEVGMKRNKVYERRK